MDPLNPVYDKMMTNTDKADTQSSMDYQNKQQSLGRQ
jgi:hypothetical protein